MKIAPSIWVFTAIMIVAPLFAAAMAKQSYRADARGIENTAYLFGSAWRTVHEVVNELLEATGSFETVDPERTGMNESMLVMDDQTALEFLVFGPERAASHDAKETLKMLGFEGFPSLAGQQILDNQIFIFIQGQMVNRVTYDAVSEKWGMSMSQVPRPIVEQLANNMAPSAPVGSTAFYDRGNLHFELDERTDTFDITIYTPADRHDSLFAPAIAN